MRKDILTVGMMLMILPTVVNAQDVNTELKKQFSSYFSDTYTSVYIANENGVNKVVFPQIEIKAYDETGEPKVGQTIPSYSVGLEDLGLFQNYPQYGLKITHPERLYGYLYSMFRIYGLNVENFVENIHYVPALNATTRHDVHAQNIRYTQKDETTGLGTDVFGAKDVKLSETYKVNKDCIEYENENSINGFGFNSSIFKMTFPTLWSKGVTKYDLGATDYTKLLTDLSRVKNAQYSFKMPEISVEAMGQMLKFGIISKGAVIRHDETQKMDFQFQLLVNNIYQNITKDFVLKKVKFAYSLENLDLADVREFNEVMEKYDAEQKQMISEGKLDEISDFLSEEVKSAPKSESDEKMEKVLNKILNNLQIKSKIKADFDNNASSELWLNVRAQEGFMVGNVRISFVNFAERLKKLASASSEKQQTPIASASDDTKTKTQNWLQYAKKTKFKDGTIADVVDILLTKEGVFVGQDKISDPIVIDEAKKMITDYVHLQA